MKTKAFLFFVLTFFVITSCRTQYVPVENTVYKTNDVYHTKYVSDTTFIADTLLVTIRGECKDSVIIKWRVRETHRIDTISVNKTDSVYVEKPIIHVPDGYYKKRWYNTFFELFGKIPLAGLVVFMIISIIKWKR